MPSAAAQRKPPVESAASGPPFYHGDMTAMWSSMNGLYPESIYGGPDRTLPYKAITVSLAKQIQFAAPA
jgi:hypothetical protein